VVGWRQTWAVGMMPFGRPILTRAEGAPGEDAAPVGIDGDRNQMIVVELPEPSRITVGEPAGS
jgi:hypothetical protein